LTLLPTVLFLLSVEPLAQILVAGAGIALVELVEGTLAVGVPLPLHGHEERSTSSGDGVEVGGQTLGGGEVAANVGGGGRETEKWI
jgi:hypothetical protein